MKKSIFGQWLFVYFFLISAVLCVILLLFGESFFKIDDTSGLIQIIIPTFIAQVVILVKWFAEKSKIDTEETIDMPKVILFLPPLIVVIILILTLTVKVIGFRTNADYTPDDAKIKIITTFCMTLLNATTIYLVTVFFNKSK